MSKKKTSSYNTSIINVFKNISNKKKLNFRQIKSRLNESNIILIKKALDTLEKQGVLKQVNPGSYVLNQKKSFSLFSTIKYPEPFLVLSIIPETVFF